MVNKTQFDVNLEHEVLMKYKKNTVFIVFQYDGFDMSKVVGVFDNRLAAVKMVEIQTKSKEGLLHSHYLKEFEVKKSVDK